MNSKLRLFPLLLPALLLPASLVRAQVTGGEASQEFAAFRVASALMPHAFPTKPMKTGELNIKAVPAFHRFAHKANLPNQSYDSGSRDQSLSGLGAVISANYGVFENDYGHFGIGVLGMFFKGDGSRISYIAASAGRPTITYRGDDRIKGGLGAFTFNYDPFKSEDGFRLPMLIGFSYVALEEKSRSEFFLPAAYSPSGADANMRNVSEVTLRSMAVTTGISPQFNAGKYVRVSPFVMLSMPFSKTKDTGELVNTTTGATLPSHRQEKAEPVPAIGLELTYKPWDLGTLIVPPIPGFPSASAYTLKIAKSFGGK